MAALPSSTAVKVMATWCLPACGARSWRTAAFSRHTRKPCYPPLRKERDMRKTVLFGASGIAATALCVVALEARAKPKSPAVTADIHIVYRLDDGRQFTHRGRFYRSRTGQVREDSSLGALITDVNAGTVTLLVADRREAHVFKV